MVVIVKCPRSGKRAYDTQRKAWGAALARMHASENPASNLRTYLCKSCKNWHLTSITEEQYAAGVEHKEATEFRDFITEIVGGVKQWNSSAT